MTLPDTETQMLWFKLSGCGLIMLSGCVFAVLLNRSENERLKRIYALLELMRFIRREIDYFCVPVNEIFKRVDKNILNACGSSGEITDFDSFIASLSPEPDEEIRSVLTSFSRELGVSYREEQLKNCDLHINTLSSLCDRAERESKKNKKLHTVLCISAAATVVILLL